MKATLQPPPGPTTALTLHQVYREPQEVQIGNIELILLLLLLASWVCYALRRLHTKAETWDQDYPPQSSLDQVLDGAEAEPRLRPLDAPRPRL